MPVDPPAAVWRLQVSSASALAAIDVPATISFGQIRRLGEAHGWKVAPTIAGPTRWSKNGASFLGCGPSANRPHVRKLFRDLVLAEFLERLEPAGRA